MPVSGVVVTLAQSADAADLAVQWIRSDERFALGEPQGASDRRLPVTIDTASSTEDQRCWEQLQAHAGIDFVDVVCVFLS